MFAQMWKRNTDELFKSEILLIQREAEKLNNKKKKQGAGELGKTGILYSYLQIT